MVSLQNCQQITLVTYMGETKKQLVVQLIQVNQHQIFDPTVAAALRYV